MVDVVRTPDERFADLPDWPHEPRYLEVDGLRLARVDEGDPDAPPVLLCHGEPTWAFLYRRVIPPLRAAGLRVIVPDLPGFGRSDKPAERGWYSYQRLCDVFAAHVEAIDPPPVTLVVHDWGGVIGLRWAVEHPHRVARLVLLNTGLYALGGRHTDAWRRFREYVAEAETLPVGGLVQGGARSELPPEVIAAYEAPFPDAASQAGVLALPLLVPVSDDDPGARDMDAARRALRDWDAPAYILWGADDPILPIRVAERFAREIPTAEGVDTVPGSHFLQEDAGPEVGDRIARFVARTT